MENEKITFWYVFWNIANGISFGVAIIVLLIINPILKSNYKEIKNLRERIELLENDNIKVEVIELN